MIPGIQEIKALAIKYSKKQLASMAQTGLIDPQKAVMAGMMRDRIAKEDMQPPTTTVAQDVLGMGPQAQPQMGMQPQPQMPQGQPQMGAPVEQPPVMAASGGLTALPVEVQDYAGGGIVAFDDGGKVPGLFESGFQFPEDSFFGAFQRNTLPFQQSPAVRNAAELQRIEQRLAEPNLSNAERQRLETGRRALINLTSESYPSEGSRGAATFVPPTTAATTGPTTFTPATAPSDAPTTRTPSVQGPRMARPGTAAPTAPAASTLKRPEITLPDLSGLKPEEFKTREARELPAIGKERMDYMRSMGIDPDMYSKMIEKEEGKRKDLQGRKEIAKGEALMEAGLGLIGARRGQEFQALGESGRRGLASLREAGKELRAAEEKLDDRINSFRMADQQAKQTGAEKDIAQRDADLARVEAAQREAVKERNSFTAKRAELGMEGVKIKSQADVSLYGTDVQKELGEKQLALKAKEIANQANYYQKSLAITEARIKSMDAATQARLGKLKMDAGKMWENSQEKFNLEKQLKAKYGDNFTRIIEAQVEAQRARDAFVGYYLDSNNALIHAAPDQSTF